MAKQEKGISSHKQLHMQISVKPHGTIWEMTAYKAGEVVEAKSQKALYTVQKSQNFNVCSIGKQPIRISALWFYKSAKRSGAIRREKGKR